MIEASPTCGCILADSPYTNKLLPIPNTQYAMSNQTDSLLGLTEWDAVDLESFLKSPLQGSRDDEGLRGGPALSLQKWHSLVGLSMFQLCIALSSYPRRSCSERNECRGIKLSVAFRQRRKKRLDWQTSYLYQLGVLF